MYFNTLPLMGKAVTGTRNLAIGLSFVLVAMSGQAHSGEGVRIPGNLCFWNEMSWRDMNSAEKAAWSGLGWKQQLWESSDTTSYPATYRQSWRDLAGKEKKLAAKLGYSSKTWGVESCPNYSTLAQKKADPAPAKRKTVVSKSVSKKISLLPPVHKNAGVIILGGMSSSVE